jgi:hypothetical protein
MQMNYSSDNISDQATCGQHKTTISISGSTWRTASSVVVSVWCWYMWMCDKYSVESCRLNVYQPSGCCCYTPLHTSIVTKAEERERHCESATPRRLWSAHIGHSPIMCCHLAMHAFHHKACQTKGSQTKTVPALYVI